ncbi:hypothetical protein EIK77_005935 [Talaromyces pinophilus]|nr:hypothetical protein EIK77_005935 [Talaromyces pinophilus]
MSIIGVYRSVPSPQSDLYRHSLAPGSDSIALRNGIQGQAQESKMSLSSGAPIFAPSAATPVKDCAASSAANTQGDPSGATTLPKPVESGQFSTQFASTNAFVERAAVQDEKGGVVSEQNRPAESWGARSSNMSASQTAQAGREHENHGEENDEDLGEDFSNGEEGDGGQGRSAGDGGDNSKKTKRFRYVFHG